MKRARESIPSKTSPKTWDHKVQRAISQSTLRPRRNQGLRRLDNCHNK